MKNQNYKIEIINVLKELSRQYPKQALAQHLSLALADYNKNFDGISDKELYFIFEKYRCEKELDTNPSELDMIIKDGMNLDTNLEDDEEDY